MTSYDSSTATACGYMASSLPYDPVLPGPSGSYLIALVGALVGTHSINHIHILCQCNVIQELETSEFSRLLIGQHRIGHPYPSYTETNFRLCFRTGNISVCNGCRNKFDKKANPPYDICVQHEEWRSYTSPTTNLPDSRFGNAYYHANPACSMSKWPSFHPQSLLISDEVKNQLQADHKSLLSSLFGIYL